MKAWRDRTHADKAIFFGRLSMSLAALSISLGIAAIVIRMAN